MIRASVWFEKDRGTATVFPSRSRTEAEAGICLKNRGKDRITRTGKQSKRQTARLERQMEEEAESMEIKKKK